MRIIAGQFKNRLLAAPKGVATRPTAGVVREAVFNICQTFIEDVDLLDLFSGSGAMAFEALSRGARSATLVENDALAIRAIRKNIDTLDVKQQATLFTTDVSRSVRQLQKLKKRYGIIFADPPYDAIEARDHLLHDIDKGDLLLPDGAFFIEESMRAPEPTIILERLELKSCRNYGRSQLRYYVYKEGA
jgi:16S rRNA (guanine966-N2)-methyltransferase